MKIVKSFANCVGGIFFIVKSFENCVGGISFYLDKISSEHATAKERFFDYIHKYLYYIGVLKKKKIA